MVLTASATFGSHADGESPTDFTHFVQIADVEVTSSRILVSQCGPPPKRNLTSLDHQGNAVPFATIPAVPDFDPAGCVSAPSMAVSPGLPGFPKGNVYVSYGPRIWIIPPEGCPGGGPSCVEEFQTSPSMDIVDNYEASFNLTFDQVGSFGYQMIAVSYGGAWTVNSSGATRRFSTAVGGGASYHPGRPVVAPDSFDPFGGHLVVPLYGDPRILFIAPSGGVSYTYYPQPGNPVGPSIEPVLVPPEVCEMGDSQGVFFQSRTSSFPQQQGIRKFRRNDFSEQEGNVLIVSGGREGIAGYQGMDFLAPTGSEPAKFDFHSDPDGSLSYGAGDFADCPDPWSVEVSDVRVDEGGPGSDTRAVFRLTLDPAPTTPTELHFQTRSGSAEEGSDYLPLSGDVTLGAGPASINGPLSGVVSVPGDSSADIEVSIVGDDVTEKDERFFLDITDPAKPDVLLAAGIARILNDDQPAPFIPPPPPGPEPPPATGPEEQPPPAPELEALPPSTAHLGPGAPAAVGPQLPPPAPPGTAPAPSAGPAPGSAPGPGVVAGQSASTVASPLSVSVPAYAPAPAPHVVPGVAGTKEEQVQAAPESDYAMVAYEEHGRGIGLPMAGAGIALLAVACIMGRAEGKKDGVARPCPCFLP